MSFKTPLESILASYKFIESTVNQAIFELKQQKHLNFKVSNVSLYENQEKLKKEILIGTNSAILLSSFIRNIIDLSKMEDDTFTVNSTNFMLTEVVEHCYDIFNDIWEQKNIKLQLDISEEAGKLRVHSDCERLKQIMLNLVYNSYKYTHNGSIKLIISLAESEHKRFIRWVVQDTGVGIKVANQAKLFKMFGTLSQKKLRNPIGSGIGLTVTKKYVEHLGGDIKLNSRSNQGTTVEVNLPLPEYSHEGDIKVERWENLAIACESLPKDDHGLDLLFSGKYSRDSKLVKF